MISGELPLSSLFTDKRPPCTAIERFCSKLTKLLASLKTLWKKNIYWRKERSPITTLPPPPPLQFWNKWLHGRSEIWTLCIFILNRLFYLNQIRCNLQFWSSISNLLVSLNTPRNTRTAIEGKQRKSNNQFSFTIFHICGRMVGLSLKRRRIFSKSSGHL